jgi:dTDP-4-dehydrorhamnose reductase
MHKLLANGKQIKVIEDSFGTPTFSVDLVKCLRELAELDLPGVYHATNDGQGTSYAGFAEKVCEIGKFDKNLLQNVSVNDLQRPAPRPVSSKLKCLFSQKLGLSPLPNWEKALSEFLSVKQT